MTFIVSRAYSTLHCFNIPPSNETAGVPGVLDELAALRPCYRETRREGAWLIESGKASDRILTRWDRRETCGLAKSRNLERRILGFRARGGRKFFPRVCDGVLIRNGTPRTGLLAWFAPVGAMCGDDPRGDLGYADLAVSNDLTVAAISSTNSNVGRALDFQ